MRFSGGFRGRDSSERNHVAAHATGFVVQIEIFFRIGLETVETLGIAEVVRSAFVRMLAGSTRGIDHHPADGIFHSGTGGSLVVVYGSVLGLLVLSGFHAY